MDETAGHARRALPALMLIGTALLFSTGGAAIKATTLSASQVVAWRSGVAAAVLFLLLPEARRRWSKRTLVVALAYAATLGLFVHANKLTTSANAVFLQATAPLYLLLIGPLLLRRSCGDWTPGWGCSWRWAWPCSCSAATRRNRPRPTRPAGT